MSASLVPYRHEYVSGVVTVVGFPASISARIANRAAIEGKVRVLVRVEDEVALDSIDSADIPNGLVEPGGVGIFGADLPKGVDAKVVSCWVQILTTSPDLVPSVAFQETVLSAEGKPVGVRQSAYFAPGDFAVFQLHLSPVEPPHLGPPKVSSGA